MIIQEIDWREPYAAFSPFAGEPHAHLLHGGDRSHDAEWSVIAAFPETVIETANMDVCEQPFEELQMLVDERAISGVSSKLPFQSGVIGYVGYEAARFIEPSLRLPPSPFVLPDISFGAYDAAAVFSRKTKQAYITGRRESACRRLEEALGDKIDVPASVPVYGALKSNFTMEKYEAAVGAVREDILNGDYYQANIAHQIKTQTTEEIPVFQLFRQLAEKSDAYYGALLQYPEGSVISNSPERFFCVNEDGNGVRKIITEPIKGTRPRGNTAAQDDALARELLRDPKDRAENVMIADLMRNDLSKVCADGSIREDEICGLMSLENVHHLVSRISGSLMESASIADIFSALFPCGSITGAPKIEAMNAIARIEVRGRGPYCGAVGYIDDRGGADFSVAIRTMMVTEENKRLTIPVGGGITFLSDPYKEYQETLDKAQAAFKAIKKSSRGLL